MIKLGNGPDGLPTHGRMAVLAGNAQVPMGATRDRRTAGLACGDGSETYQPSRPSDQPQPRK